MNKNVFSFLALLFLIAFSNCKSDDELQEEMPPTQEDDKKCFLLKEWSNDILVREFTLNDENQVIHYKSFSHFDGEILLSEDRTYNTTGELTRRDQFNSGGDLFRFYTYEYFGTDSIICNQFRIINGAEKFHDYSVFHFNMSENCTFSSRYFYDAETSELKQYYIAEYLDDNCSVVFTTYSEKGNLISISKSIHDDKHGADHLVMTPPFAEVNQHNALKREWSDPSGEFVKELTFDSVFEYDENDYPIKETKTFLDGNVFEYTYEYKCE